MDHTQSILAKLSPLVDKGSELIFVRALKTVVGFYTQRAAAAAKELMWEMVVARPEVYRGEEAKRLLCDRGFVLALKAPLSWEDLSPSLLPTARSLMDVLLAEITGEVVVLTDMDPNLTSAALKLKTERVTCLDYENHQDLLLHTFEVTSLTQLAAYASDFEALCKHYWNKMRPELFSERQIRTLRKLIKSASEAVRVLLAPRHFLVEGVEHGPFSSVSGPRGHRGPAVPTAESTGFGALCW